MKLVDFGLVKLVEDDLSLTQSGMLCGSPLYISPEQASNKPMDPRTDLYSLGAAYYTLLAGRPPFTANGVPQILLAHLTSPTPDPREVVADIPEACVNVVMTAMAKKPDDRFQSAAEMGAALEAILAGVPQRNMSVFAMQESAPSIAAAVDLMTGRSGSTSGQGLSASGSRSRLLNSTVAAQKEEVAPPATSRRGFLAAAGLAVLGVGGYFVQRRFAKDGSSGRAGAAGVSDAGTDAGSTKAVAGSGGPPIKVGILHSLSGALAVSEHPLSDSSLLAIEELNARGGVLGRKILPVVMDGKSEISADSAFTRAAEKLLETDKVAVVFGGFGSAGRKVIRPYFEKHDRLLFYPAQYEGIEESQNLVYTGSTPNQLAVPAIQWCAETLKAKKYFLIGTDGLRAHATNAIIEDTIESLGGEVVGTHYAVVGESQFSTVVRKIAHEHPDVIINTLVGDSVLSFFKDLLEADITSSAMPVMSFTFGENELAQLKDPFLAGHYVARTRFPVQAGSTEATFEQRFKKMYGSHRPVSETMESAYYGVLLWAAAVEKAGSEEVNSVRLALKGHDFALGNVSIRVDASNLHTWKLFQVGQVTPDNRISVTKTGEEPIPPVPFPPPRTRADWQSFSDALYKKWGGNWANPTKPKQKKSKKH